MITKKELRAKLRLQAKESPSSHYAAEDRASVEALLATAAYTQCTTLFGFSPIQGEVDITAVLEHAITHKRVALPRCTGDTITFFYVSQGWNQEIEPSPFGVLEPASGEVAHPDSNSLILVPAMAYTPSGVRLGRGKGYYDRYLQNYVSACTVGVCRSYQLLDTIPQDRWDWVVDEVLCCGVFYRT